MLSSLNIVIPIYQLLLMFDIGVSSFLDQPEKISKKTSDSSYPGEDGDISPAEETPEMGGLYKAFLYNCTTTIFKLFNPLLFFLYFDMT